MILVLGLGNPVLSDDGVGIHVINALRERKIPGVDARECFSDFDLMEAINRKYSRIIIVDAVKTGNEPGTVYYASIENFPVRFSTHNIDLNLLKIENLPEITILAIEVEDTETISERCTQAVERAISEILNIIENLSFETYHQTKQKVKKH
ncbi:MAG TPA: hydrogenase maturation protease [Archaeoglobaceae archaeon]|nr:hydrogenase maturation protease [Archaeoglobaceae archaeon]